MHRRRHRRRLRAEQPPAEVERRCVTRHAHSSRRIVCISDARTEASWLPVMWRLVACDAARGTTPHLHSMRPPGLSRRSCRHREPHDEVPGHARVRVVVQELSV
jgi:hypothetical protein